MKHTQEEMEQMSLEDLARHAREPEVETAPVTSAVQAEGEKEAETGGPFLVRREIDLGDGSGLEVFEAVGDSEAEAWEAWADKITDAKAHATRKIRELSQELRQAKAAPATLANTQPLVQTLEEKIAALEGKITTMQQMEQARIVGAEAADLFLASHPDYENDPAKGGRENADRLKYELDRMKLDYTSENLHKAYSTLKNRGLLSLKGEEGASGNETQREERISQPEVEVAQKTQRSFSINTHNRVPPPINTEPSEDDLYSMPLDKLKILSNKQMASR
jgi:hypothetical protein